MQGTYESYLYCPTVTMWLLALLAIVLVYVVADGWLRSRPLHDHGTAPHPRPPHATPSRPISHETSMG